MASLFVLIGAFSFVFCSRHCCILWETGSHSPVIAEDSPLSPILQVTLAPSPCADT